MLEIGDTVRLKKGEASSRYPNLKDVLMTVKARPYTKFGVEMTEVSFSLARRKVDPIGVTKEKHLDSSAVIPTRYLEKAEI